MFHVSIDSLIQDISMKKKNPLYEWVLNF